MTMIDSQMIAPVGQLLTDEQIIEALHKGLEVSSRINAFWF